MAFEQPGFSFTLVAAADLSASQFRACNVDATGKAALPAAGGRIVGIIQNKPKIAESTTIMLMGISIVEAGAAIVAGADLQTEATGRMITAVATNQIAAIALEAASAAGVFIAVLLKQGARIL